MEGLYSQNIILTTGLIFCLRLLDMTCDTMRVLFVIRGRKSTAWIVGFTQATIFILAISAVLSGLNNPIKIVAYAAGFATGNVFGMWLEEKLAIGFSHLTIISPAKGTALADSIRSQGFAVTEIPGRGKDGSVTVLRCDIQRKQFKELNSIISRVDDSAFVTCEEIRPIRRGYFRPRQSRWMAYKNSDNPANF